MESKRGQALSTNAIILIILGVVVLVILIAGFTLGWNKILPFISTNNVDTIKNSCNIACSTESAFDYCSFEREVKDGVNDKFSETCNNLANDPDEKYGSRNYGIETCSAITCPSN